MASKAQGQTLSPAVQGSHQRELPLLPASLDRLAERTLIPPLVSSLNVLGELTSPHGAQVPSWGHLWVRGQFWPPLSWTAEAAPVPSCALPQAQIGPGGDRSAGLRTTASKMAGDGGGGKPAEEPPFLAPSRPPVHSLPGRDTALGTYLPPPPRLSANTARASSPPRWEKPPGPEGLDLKPPDPNTSRNRSKK